VAGRDHPSALSFLPANKEESPVRRKSLRTAAKRRRKAIKQPLKGAQIRRKIAIRKKRKRKKPGKK
jgi:hypothetical protein